MLAPSVARGVAPGSAKDKSSLTLANNENKVLEPARKFVTEATKQSLSQQSAGMASSQDREMKDTSSIKRPILERRESSMSGRSSRMYGSGSQKEGKERSGKHNHSSNKHHHKERAKEKR